MRSSSTLGTRTAPTAATPTAPTVATPTAPTVVTPTAPTVATPTAPTADASHLEWLVRRQPHPDAPGLTDLVDDVERFRALDVYRVPRVTSPTTRDPTP